MAPMATKRIPVRTSAGIGLLMPVFPDQTHDAQDFGSVNLASHKRFVSAWLATSLLQEFPFRDLRRPSWPQIKFVAERVATNRSERPICNKIEEFSYQLATDSRKMFPVERQRNTQDYTY